MNNISFAHLDIAIFAQSFLTKLLHLNEKAKKVKMKFKFSLGLGSVSPSVKSGISALWEDQLSATAGQFAPTILHTVLFFKAFSI